MIILILKLLICWILLRSALHKIQAPDYIYEAFQKFDIKIINISINKIRLTGIFEMVLISLWGISALHETISLFIFMLFLMYTSLLFNVYRKGKKGINCGCSGPSVHTEIGIGLLMRNLCYLVLVLIVGLKDQSNALNVLTSFWGYSFGILMSIILFLFLVSCEQLMSNRILINKIKKY